VIANRLDLRHGVHFHLTSRLTVLGSDDDVPKVRWPRLCRLVETDATFYSLEPRTIADHRGGGASRRITRPIEPGRDMIVEATLATRRARIRHAVKPAASSGPSSSAPPAVWVDDAATPSGCTRGGRTSTGVIP
jgi:hypothetical protein